MILFTFVLHFLPYTRLLGVNCSFIFKDKPFQLLSRGFIRKWRGQCALVPCEFTYDNVTEKLLFALFTLVTMSDILVPTTNCSNTLLESKKTIREVKLEERFSTCPQTVEWEANHGEHGHKEYFRALILEDQTKKIGLTGNYGKCDAGCDSSHRNPVYIYTKLEE